MLLNVNLQSSLLQPCFRALKVCSRSKYSKSYHSRERKIHENFLCFSRCSSLERKNAWCVLTVPCFLPHLPDFLKETLKLVSEGRERKLESISCPSSFFTLWLWLSLSKSSKEHFLFLLPDCGGASCVVCCCRCGQ